MVDFRKYTVKVEGNKVGSGVIINALSNEYDYLLTAKHLIDSCKTKEIKITGIWLNDKNQISRKKIKLFENNVFKHQNKNIDAAIIKIDKGFVDNDLQVSTHKDKNELLLCGYPQTRQNEHDPYKTFKINLNSPKENGYYEATIESSMAPNRPDVEGFSGGGIFAKSETCKVLTAIQSCMATDDINEMHGRILIMPMALFYNIIEEYKLAPILPDYLKCFSTYKNEIFPLNTFFDNNIAYTREFLRALTDKVVESNIFPYMLENTLNTRLLIKGKSKEALTNKLLWKSWLEFLIVNYIFSDKKIDLKQIFNNKRLLFSNSNLDWSQIIKQILESDFKDLKKKGNIIISTKEKPTTETILTGEIIENIVRAIKLEDNRFMIDEGIENPLVDFKFIHLYAFSKDCILDKHNEYAGFNFLNKDELLNKLKEEYERIFN